MPPEVENANIYDHANKPGGSWTLPAEQPMCDIVPRRPWPHRDSRRISRSSALHVVSVDS
eukprot:5844760-Alexandrium_andersonii.AAC.1